MDELNSSYVFGHEPVAEHGPVLERYVAPVVFSFIIFIGVVGNGLLIYTIVSNSVMQTVSNIFLLSLSIGDLMVIMVSAPLRLLSFLSYDYWPSGAFLCHIYSFLVNLSQGVSIFTLTALSVDRFVAIVLPMVSLGWSSKRRTTITCVLLWLLAIVFAAPDIITSRIQPIHVENNTGELTICNLYAIVDQFDVDHHPYVITRRVFNLIVYYIVPLIVISTMYISIAVSLIKNSSTSVCNNLNPGGIVTWEKQMAARRYIAKIVVIIALFFFVCWTPHHFTTLYWNYSTNEYIYEDIKYLNFVNFVLLFSNSCVNPPILYLMSSEFRRYFNHCLFGCCCKSKRIESVHRSSDACLTNVTNVNR